MSSESVFSDKQIANLNKAIISIRDYRLNATKVISDTARTIGFGLSGLLYSSIYSSNNNLPFYTYKKHLAIASLFGVLVVMIDFFQSFAAMAQASRSRALLENDIGMNRMPTNEDIYRYEKNPFFYIRGFLFYAKIAFVFSGCSVIILVMTLLIINNK